jgi:ABC-type sugar transport system ATPase subunit
MIQGDDLTVQAGAFRLKNVSFSIPTGSYCVLMGKTGSGKTTLLEAVCGLKRIVSGKLRLFGEDVAHLKAAERGIGFVPQEGALFETMTVRAHLEFAMRIRRWPRQSIHQRVDELAALLGVEPLLHRLPRGLSGGESQRVSLGRALSFRPRILCLDEPLSALDDDTRFEMIDLLKHVQHETGVTALHVTHNRSEAELLANEHLRIIDGQVLVEKAVEKAAAAASPRG